MNWDNFELGWQAAFFNGWEAFCLGTIPIGAAIMNENNE